MHTRNTRNLPPTSTSSIILLMLEKSLSDLTKMLKLLAKKNRRIIVAIATSKQALVHLSPRLKARRLNFSVSESEGDLKKLRIIFLRTDLLWLSVKIYSMEVISSKYIRFFITHHSLSWISTMMPKNVFTGSPAAIWDHTQKLVTLLRKSE